MNKKQIEQAEQMKIKYEMRQNLSSKPKPKVLAIISIGHHSRASNLVITEEQRRDLEDVQSKLTEFFDGLFPEWDTINIEVSKYE